MDIRNLLATAHKLGATDFHATVGAPPVYRVHGRLQPHGEQRLTPADTEAMVRQLLSEPQLELLKRHGEYDSSIGLPGVSRFRLNCYRQRSSYALAARVIPSKVPTIDELGLPQVLKVVVREKQGLVLVTGPTGSGKTTTLAAMIHSINAAMPKHIVTLENPIEYMHRHGKSLVNQREVGFDTGSFASGLRAALRQDPDIILIGEMRDLETTRTAITAAETGHLVLATLHTVSAASSMERIIDVFPPEQQDMVRSQLATVLVATVSQRLFARLDGEGLVAALEILRNNKAVANLVRHAKFHQLDSIMQTSIEQGMQTMPKAVTALLRAGRIHRDDARPYLK